MINTHQRFFVTLVAFLLLVSPKSGEAFAPTSTEVIQVTETSFIFLIEYTLGYKKYDMEVPLFGSEFVIDSTDPEVNVYKTAAVTISDTPITDDSYRLKAGTGNQFKFLAVVDLAQALPEGGMLRMKMTSLPFNLVEVGTNTSWSNGLSAGELEDFVVATTL